MVRPAIINLATAAVAAANPLSGPEKRTTNTSTVFSFAEVPISTSIQWTPCFENFTCANLKVPLDYADPVAGNTHVAFMKLAAAQQPAKGDILLNPGGPGESGASTGFISSAASLLGTSYNLVGMDPRGVNNSGPMAECFEDPYVRDYFINQIWLSDVDVTDEKVRREFWNTVGGLNDLCLKSRNDTVRYINTPAAAQDMLHYAEKLAEAEGKEPSEALVNFYGISYGTTLGMTFAKLFPNRLGRFIIDGVADIEDYYSGRWMNGISQADASLDAFFTQCHEAGAKCAFNRNSTSTEALKKDYAAIIADLEENPVRVIDPAYVEFPILITALDVRAAVFIQLYRSLPGFGVIDTVLSELAQGRNVTTLLVLLNAISGTQARGLVPRERTYVPGYSSLLPRMDIACTDMNQRYNISSPDVFAEYIQETVELSKHFGDLWAGLITVKCWNRQITPPESQVFPAEFGIVKTNNPILLTANTLDPVTSSQDRMSSFFPGSRVLLQDAVGHGVLSVPSNCTSGHIIHYVETGELPPEGVICPANVRPFEAPVANR